MVSRKKEKTMTERKNATLTGFSLSRSGLEMGIMITHYCCIFSYRTYSRRVSRRVDSGWAARAGYGINRALRRTIGRAPTAVAHPPHFPGPRTFA